MGATAAVSKAEAVYTTAKKAIETNPASVIGSTRIEATIGSTKSKSSNQSYKETNDSSSINAASLSIISTGRGEDSDVIINGSQVNISQDAFIKVDDNFIMNGVVQNSSANSTNKSSSAAIGGYAAYTPGTGTSAGITANASGAKGHSDGNQQTYDNTHFTVSGTTTLDIGGDVIADAAVFKTDHLTGNVAGDIIGISRQDTAVHDGDQKSVGVSVDIDLASGGFGTSVSLNGGKTDIDANYASVTEQSGYQMNSTDLQVGGKAIMEGAYFLTETEDDNQAIFAGGVEIRDINNINAYDASSISGGVTLGKNNKVKNPSGKDTANINGIGYGKDGDSSSSVTIGAITGQGNNPTVTLADVDSLNKPLENTFDAKNELRDAKDQLERGEITEQAYNDYKTNLVATTANLVNAQINLGSTVATAAGTSATGGFSGSVNAEHSKTVSTDTQSTGTWQGTGFKSAETTLVGGDHTFIGAEGNLGTLYVDNLDSLTLKAGTNTMTSSSSSKTNAQTASINSAGNMGLGASTQKSESQSSSTTKTNTKLNVDSLNGHADTTTLNGGSFNISGDDEGSYSTKKLHIETVYNTSSSSNKSSGANTSINANIATGVPIPTGGSLGFNKSNGNSQSETLAETSGIVDRGNKQSFTVGDTVNIGGILANIQTDSEGQQSNGTLNFTTHTLQTSNLINTVTSDQSSIGGSIGVGIGKQDQSINNLGIQVGHTGQDFESTGLATVGEGVIVTSDAITGKDSLAGLNRDAFNTEIIIKDQQTAGLNVDANIDARVFTEAGRDEIIEEQKELVENARQLGNNIEDSVVLGYETSNNIYKSILVLKKIEEIRATLTPEEQVIFDNELRKLQTEESLKSNVAPVAIGIGAGVAIGGAEIAAAGAAGGVYICSQVDVCSETVANGLDNAYDNAKAGSQAVQDYAVGIFSKKSGSNKKAKVLPVSSNVASTPPDPDEEGGVRLTGGGKKTLGNLTNLKDKTVADAVRSRGGTGSNVNKVASHLRNEKVGEIANRAARGDADAATALKIIKDAKRLAQKR